MIRALALVFAFASAAYAEPLAVSPHPYPNPRAAEAGVALASPAVLRPMPRPEALAYAPLPEAPAPETGLDAGVAAASLARPSQEAPKKGLFAKLKPRKKADPEEDPAPEYAENGFLCGTRGIKGQAIAPIKASAKGCGLQHGVMVTEVSGIPLSTPAKIDCMTAIALKSWVDNGIKPAIGRKGGGLKRLDIAASYACRPRNNQAGNKISEHGRGKAVDLAGVTLRDGTSLTVLKDWRGNGGVMRAIHASACGTFGTVLGPKSDRFHRDHFHVDTAKQTNGAYCR